MKKSPWIRDTRPKLVYLNTWSINHIIFRTTWKGTETQSVTNRPSFRPISVSKTWDQTDAAALSTSALLTCATQPRLTVPLRAKRIKIKRAGDAADGVVTLVPRSSEAPVWCHPQANINKCNYHNTGAPPSPIPDVLVTTCTRWRDRDKSLSSNSFRQQTTALRLNNVAF